LYMARLMAKCIMGIFVGGNSSRMGGRPKGLLRSPLDAKLTLVQHFQEMAQQLGIESVLVGAKTDYSHLGMHTLTDEPAGVGPIGGLHAFLAYCLTQEAWAVAVACDMPYVSLELVNRLCTAAGDCPVLAPRDSRSQRWEPLFARYEPRRVIPIVQDRLSLNDHSLQSVLKLAAGETLPLTVEEWAMLRDWDEEQDITQ
jgi:molybdopterin-guanine dinucleotide biosynthesis protein A